MNKRQELRLNFWGVRGSIPTPQVENLGFGGNTPCLEVRYGSQLLIFDAGSGLRMLGHKLQQEFGQKKMDLCLFLTHFHWDHIQGIPFFSPLYRENNEVRFYSGALQGGLREKLEGQMSKPYFPVNFETLTAVRSFIEIPRRSIRCGQVIIHPFELNHPQGCSGYRIETPAGIIVYATDLEHGDPRLDKVVRDYSQGADILIYDAQYTPEEYASHRGWGHSTWAEGIKTARDAGAKRLILFHHDPMHSDDMLREIERNARREFENTSAATENTAIVLNRDPVHTEWRGFPPDAVRNDRV
jgi:phosphoribosyl 1,2-cyclic phosphodiesterase